MPHRIADVNDRIKRAMASGITLSSGAGGGDSGSGAMSPARRGGAGDASPTASGGAGTGDVLATGKAWQATGEYSLAIDALLAVGTTTDALAGSRSQAALYDAWVTAVRLSASHAPGRQYDITEEVAHRLCDELGHYEEAGDLFMDLDQADKAAQCFVQAQCWDKARTAARAAPARIRDAIEGAIRSAMAKAGATGGAEASSAASSPAAGPSGGANRAELDAAIAAAAAAGDYDKLFETASKAGSATLAQHIYPFVTARLDDGDVSTAVQALSRYSAPASAAHLPVYKRLVAALFAGPRSANPPSEVVSAARDVMYKVVAALRRPGSDATPAALAGECHAFPSCTTRTDHRSRTLSHCCVPACLRPLAYALLQSWTRSSCCCTTHPFSPGTPASWRCRTCRPAQRCPCYALPAPCFRLTGHSSRRVSLAATQAPRLLRSCC